MQCVLKILPYFLKNSCFHKFIRTSSYYSKIDSIVLTRFHSTRGDRFNFTSDHFTDITNYNTPLLFFQSILNDFDTGNVLIIGRSRRGERSFAIDRSQLPACNCPKGLIRGIRRNLREYRISDVYLNPPSPSSLR